MIPTSQQASSWGDPHALDVFAEPLPLVVEIWSPSTGSYDLETKIRGYQKRCDREIWRIHPYDRSLTGWRRTPDGQYVAAAHQGGRVAAVALPNVVVDLDELLAE